MWPVFTSIANNAGMTFENIILIIVLLSGLVIYAKDFKLGLIVQLVSMGSLFIWFYSTGLNYANVLIVFFMTLVLLSFSIFQVSRAGKSGSFI